MSTVTADDARNELKILGVIGAGHFISHYYYMCLPPLFLHLREAFGATYAELGVMLAVMSAASAVVQVPIGFLVDRYGARTILTAGLAVVSIATGLIGFAHSFWLVVALSFISGLGNAVFHPADYAILNSSIGSNRMGRAFSLHTFTGQLGTAAAPVVMIALTAFVGWRAALMFSGVFGLLTLAFLTTQWNALRDDTVGAAPRPEPADSAVTPQSGDAGPKNAIAAVFTRPMLLFFLFFMMLSMMQTGLQAFVVAALVTVHDTPLAVASTALSVYLFCSAGGVLLGGEITDRMQRHDLLAALIFVLSAIIVLALGAFNLPAAVLIGLMAVMGVAQGVTRPARDLMLRAAAPKGATGSVFGFVTAGIAFGSALAPIPLGWLIDIGRPAWVFYLLAAFMLIALATVATPKGAAIRT